MLRSVDSHPIGSSSSDAILSEALAEFRASFRARRRRGSRSALRGFDASAHALYQGLRLRLGGFGVRERRAEFDDFGMDPEWAAVLDPFLQALFDSRGGIAAASELPAAPFLVTVVARRPPWEGLLLSHALARLGEGAPRVHFTVPDPLPSRPFLQPVLARLGAVRACRENAEHLFASGRSLIGPSDATALRAARAAAVPVVSATLTGGRRGSWRVRFRRRR